MGQNDRRAPARLQAQSARIDEASIGHWSLVLRRLDLTGLLQTDEPFRQTGGSGAALVECRKPKQLPEQAEACNAAEIRAHITWVLPDGRRKVGMQSLEALSLWSGLN